ncbi:MAG: hypothetical protein WCC46_00845, partial [Terriglobales bacterium]
FTLPRGWGRLPTLIFLFFLFIRIIDLGKNSRQISGFKGLICNILRNKDLEVPGFRVSRFQSVQSRQTGKGRGSYPHPFDFYF